MELKNNDQNSVIFSIAEILSKMSNQVGFLIRNDKLMSQLDVDILMENTRKLYDTICSVRCNMDADSIPMEVVKNDESDDLEEIDAQRYKDVEVSAGLEIKNEEIEIEFESQDVAEDNYVHDEEDSDDGIVEEDYIDEKEVVEMTFSDDEDKEEIIEDEEIKIDFEIPISEDLPQETPLYASSEDSGIRAYKKINNEYHTLGDVLEQTEDNSLVTRLQRKPVADLTNAIGINDKFLLLNELFSGSMEKYNKSIRALNNFSTLLGAKTYLGELQIELQWNCDSEAYKKLVDLVERRFI